MSLLITKANDKNQTLISINEVGIFYQELRLGDRPKSNRVKIGSVALVDDSVQALSSEWDAFDMLVQRLNVVEKRLKAIATTKDEQVTVESDSLKIEFNNLQTAIDNDPLSKLTTLSVKVVADLDKLVNTARYKHQWRSSGFSHHPTREYFLQRQAEDLVKRQNAALEAAGIESGYLDFQSAYAVIVKRYSRNVSSITLTDTPVPVVDTTTTALATDNNSNGNGKRKKAAAV